MFGCTHRVELSAQIHPEICEDGSAENFAKIKQMKLLLNFPRDKDFVSMEPDSREDKFLTSMDRTGGDPLPGVSFKNERRPLPNNYMGSLAKLSSSVSNRPAYDKL